MDEKEAKARDEERRRDFERRDEQARQAWHELGDLFCEIMEGDDYEGSGYGLVGDDW